jgi:hypothetical protein
MNFSPVGVDSKGMPYMKFNKPFTIVERIQLLQRSIFVNSFAYYELDENILPDFKYDANALQLAGLRAQYPEEFRRSRYHDYFYDFCSDGVAYTSGFDLIERVRKKDAELYRFLRIDACMALESKRKYSAT